MKKILFLTYDFPYPPNSGGKARAYNLIKFSNKDLDVRLFSFVRHTFRTNHIDELQKAGVNHVEVFKRRPTKHIKNVVSLIPGTGSIFKTIYYTDHLLSKLVRYIQQEEIDVVHFESFYTGYYISDRIKKLGVRQIFGSENIEYKIYEDYGKRVSIFVRFPYVQQISKIHDEEEYMAKNADLTLAVTSEEASYFSKFGTKTEVIPNGVDIKEFSYKPSTRLGGNKLLFVGNFSYFPNREGILFFYNEVFKKLPGDYTLKIIGRGVNTLGIADSKVELIEFIPEIVDAYYEADILISPIRIGGGTNFKVIEAAACGLPVIIHCARAASFGMTNGEEILCAETAEEFIQQIEKLSQNDGLQGKLSSHAREFVEKNFSWEIIGRKLNTIWKTI